MTTAGGDARTGTPFGPGGRPTAGLRPWLAGVVVLGAVLAVPIMLLDRAPDVFDRITDEIEERWFPDVWWHDIKPLVPEADVVMHVVLFGGLALLAALLAWSWPVLLAGQAAVFGGAFALELLQPLVTSSRDIEVHDMVSNVSGQALGLLVGLALIGLERWWSRRRSGERASL
ncbi:hypothetical protein [Actinomarinicola tropica]|uniref:VanZ-like domain-containing protein n=1 Tax=Actinomarinicola tropica TaxID=2789776 RepID=A0A5Q2RSH7_9ACTN|nr:hypothetical protein [Actinomarinicola tropica]QGG96860.1 hypothetical protein GH723_18130 [Actinomarinicola tropica]